MRLASLLFIIGINMTYKVNHDIYLQMWLIIYFWKIFSFKDFNMYIIFIIFINLKCRLGAASTTLNRSHTSKVISWVYFMTLQWVVWALSDTIKMICQEKVLELLTSQFTGIWYVTDPEWSQTFPLTGYFSCFFFSNVQSGPLSNLSDYL